MARNKRRKEKKNPRKKPVGKAKGLATPDGDRHALDVFRRLYCSREAGPIPDSQAPAIIHLNRVMRALYQTHNDELLATFGDTWKEYAFQWGPLREMLGLAIHTYQVAFGLHVSGNPREAKSLARSALETAIDIQYIVQDTKPRFVAYLLATLDQHEKKLRLWGKCLDDQPIVAYPDSRSIQADMLAAIVKDQARWRNTARIWGLAVQPTWESNVFERFRATGNELMYRSTYALLCSETHMDASEILNIMTLIDNDPATVNRIKDAYTEDVYGNLIVVLSAIIDAVKQYAATFKLPAIAKAADADGTFIVVPV